VVKNIPKIICLFGILEKELPEERFLLLIETVKCSHTKNKTNKKERKRHNPVIKKYSDNR